MAIRTTLRTTSNIVAELDQQMQHINKYLDDLKQCDSLTQVFECHKRMWNDGIQHKNIGPDQYGLFRTDDIATMLPREVYLGGIYGLDTLRMDYWINRPEEPVVMEQYRGHLTSNLKMLRAQIFDNGYSREKMEKNILMLSNDMLPKSEQLTKVRILDKSIYDNKFITVQYFDRDHLYGMREGTFQRPSTFMILNLDGRFLIPDFQKSGYVHKDIRLDKTNFMDFRYADMSRSDGTISWVSLQKKDAKNVEKSNTEKLTHSEAVRSAKNFNKKVGIKL